MRTTRRGSSGSSGSSDSTSLVSNSLSPIPEEHYYRTWGEWPSTTTTGIQPPAYSLHSDYDSYLGIDEESDSGSSSVISFSVITDQLLRSDSIKNSETPKLSKKLLNHQHFDTKVKMAHTKDDEESSTLRLASESSYDSDDASSPRTPTLRRFKTHENLRQAIETEEHKNEDVSKTTEIHQPLKRHPAMSPNTWKKEFSQVCKTFHV